MKNNTLEHLIPIDWQIGRILEIAGERIIETQLLYFGKGAKNQGHAQKCAIAFSPVDTYR